MAFDLALMLPFILHSSSFGNREESPRDLESQTLFREIQISTVDPTATAFAVADGQHDSSLLQTLPQTTIGTTTDPQPQTLIPLDPASNGLVTYTVDDSERIGKLVQPVSLFVASTSITLLLTSTTPSSLQSHYIIFTAHTAMIYLSLFTGLGLSVYTAVSDRRTSPALVVCVQKMLMAMALTFVSLALLLRTAFVIPAVLPFVFVFLLFFLLALGSIRRLGTRIMQGS